ncbi:MAG: hypothetical protein ABII00_12130 [Elusimicrobiota bacterium]
MRKNRSAWVRLAAAGLALSFAYLYAVVLPSHRHADGRVHEDCVSCITAAQDLQAPATGGTLPEPGLRPVGETPAFRISPVLRRVFAFFRLRAPPLLG